MNPEAPRMDLAQVLWQGLENSQREDSPQRQDEQKGLAQRDKSMKGSWNRDPAHRTDDENSHTKIQQAETIEDETKDIFIATPSKITNDPRRSPLSLRLFDLN
jgi:hypothetical protein